jgi:hypothetical protein
MNFKEIPRTIQKHSYFPKYSGWIFILLFIILSGIYNYHHILFYPPQSVHQWRQCDCLSLTMNYYQDNNPFFQPSVHYLGWDGTGKTVSDFPIIYFAVAKLWKIFGQHEFIYRLIVILFFLAGLFALFKTFELILKDSLLAITAGLLLFTSPTLVYYANNFLMDIPAFSLALAGIYFFFRFSKSSDNKHLYLFAAFFALAGLLKISSLLAFMAVLGIFILELFRIEFIPGRKVFQHPWKQFPVLAGVLVVQLVWFSYAAMYNAKYNGGIFLVGILPVWDLGRAEIIATFNAVYEHIKWDYFRKETQMIFVLMFIFILFFYRKMNKLLLAMVIFTSIGVLVFSVLFFQALNRHDYYTINLFVLIPFIFLGFLLLLKERFNRVYISVFFKILLIAFLVHNIDFARRRIENRYSPASWQNKEYMEKIRPFTEISPYLESIGIHKNDRVLSLSDNSINVSLYLMNQKGWTNYGIESDSVKIREKIGLGAKYLFIYNEKTLDEPGVKPFIDNKIGEYKNIEVFKLL